jgi:hypothetical protein
MPIFRITATSPADLQAQVTALSPLLTVYQFSVYKSNSGPYILTGFTENSATPTTFEFRTGQSVDNVIAELTSILGSDSLVELRTGQFPNGQFWGVISAS